MTVDPRTFRLAVAFLGLALLACIAGICTLSALHDTIPDSLTTIAGVVGGALAGLFVTPHSDTPQPVTVTDQPVAVTDAPPAKVRRASRKLNGDRGDILQSLVYVLVCVIVVVLIVWLFRAVF